MDVLCGEPNETESVGKKVYSRHGDVRFAATLGKGRTKSKGHYDSGKNARRLRKKRERKGGKRKAEGTEAFDGR